MKSKILSIFVFTLLTSSLLGVTITAEEESFLKENYETIVFSEPNIIEEDGFTSIKIEEATQDLMEPGKPILPTYSKIFTYPFGTKIKNVECRPLQISQKSISGEVRPSPKPVLMDNVNNLDNFEYKDKVVYNSMDLYPESWYDYSIGCGLDDNRRVVFLRIQFYPVRYSPGKNLIQYANSIDLKIEYQEPSQPVVFPDQYDMVIFTHDEFYEKMQPLADYKNDCGFETILVTLDEVYNGDYFPVQGRDYPENIKYFIKDAIENWNITYVLLAGGINKVPVRLTYVQDGEEINFVSDLYYADIYKSNGDFCSWDSNDNDIFGEYDYEGRTDIVDLYPDVCLGRLNFRDLDEIDGVINKLITYESTGAYMEDWFSDFVVIGGDTFPDFDNLCEGEYLNENAIGIMGGFNPEKIWATNGKLKYAINIDSAIENGTGFLYMTGHGTHDNWVTHPPNDFDTWWPLTGYYYFKVELLKNGELLPVVIIGGCSNCQFTGKNCFGWSWLKNPDGGGIASYGYSALGWGYPGYGCTSGLTGGMELSAIKAYGTYEAKTPGELWVKALNTYLNEIGVYFAHGYKCVEEFTTFCDPALRIRWASDKPNIPDKPDGPTLGGIGLEYTYTTTGTDPNGGYIKYCFDWGDDTVKWSDWYSSGQTASCSHRWDKPGDYEIKVKARDQYGLDSEWSEPLLVTIVSEAPFFDIVKIKGGLGSVTATIKNIGLLEAYDVNLNISVKGGIFGFIDKFNEDTFEILGVDEEITISTGNIFGLGKIEAMISASSPSANTTTSSVEGFVLGPFVIIQK
ncbi:MAG: hypothetical protein JSU91_03725 [Thermoplasmatales archaeon]|nr:MAG: hypothetical protein JSU91_03725 [Thermoplasmatales archaeon]